MKNKPLKIEIKFEVFDDDPLKKEILKAFANLMKLLEASNDPKSTGTRWQKGNPNDRDKTLQPFDPGRDAHAPF